MSRHLNILALFMRSRGFNDSDGIQNLIEKEYQSFRSQDSKTAKRMIPIVTLKVVRFHLYPFIKNYQRNDGSAFMEKVSQPPGEESGGPSGEKGGPRRKQGTGINAQSPVIIVFLVL